MPGTCPVGQEVEMEDNYKEVKKEEPCLKLIHMDQVEVEEIEWLFYPFIPYGKVTIIQGDPGEGKTTVVLQIIAKLTKGEAILSETSEGKSEEIGVEPINVIYQTAEDGLGDTIKPRLLAAGADCSRVLVIDDQEQPLTMVDARLEEAIIQTKARLVVLDPIQGFLGVGVDMHRANEIRPLMKRISVLAEKYQCAIILIGHMNKNSNGKSSYRGLGSIDFQAAARSVLIVGRVKDLLKRTISFMTGKGSLNHNSRKFHAKNTDPNRTHWNVEYCNENIKDVYHELFDEALKRYNDKQTRKDRKIDDYYEKIRSGKQEKLFHEVILQIGDKDNMGSETMEGQLAAKILDEYMKGFQERNPTLRVFAAHLHLDEATPHLHIDFIPYVTGSKRGLDTRVSLKQALSSLGFKGGSRSETELNQWVQSEKQKLAMVMRENEIEWDQKGTHEPHLSVLDYKKKVREQEVEELTEHKNLLEHDLHDISECVDEIQKEKEQVEKERDAVIKKTEVLEKRFSALNSKAGRVDSHAREYGYYPEEWLPEAGTLESAKSYRKRIFPLVKKVANMIQVLYSKYLDLKNKNQKLSDRNSDLENRVDRLREEISVIKKDNVALLNVVYDMDRVVAVLGEDKVKEAIEVAKHLEQENARQKIKKRRIDRENR